MRTGRGQRELIAELVIGLLFDILCYADRLQDVWSLLNTHTHTHTNVYMYTLSFVLSVC